MPDNNDTREACDDAEIFEALLSNFPSIYTQIQLHLTYTIAVQIAVDGSNKSSQYKNFYEEQAVNILGNYVAQFQKIIGPDTAFTTAVTNFVNEASKLPAPYTQESFQDQVTQLNDNYKKLLSFTEQDLEDALTDATFAKPIANMQIMSQVAKAIYAIESYFFVACGLIKSKDTFTCPDIEQFMTLIASRVDVTPIPFHYLFQAIASTTSVCQYDAQAHSPYNTFRDSLIEDTFSTKGQTYQAIEYLYNDVINFKACYVDIQTILGNMENQFTAAGKAAEAPTVSCPSSQGNPGFNYDSDKWLDYTSYFEVLDTIQTTYDSMCSFGLGNCPLGRLTFVPCERFNEVRAILDNRWLIMSLQFVAYSTNMFAPLMDSNHDTLTYESANMTAVTFLYEVFDDASDYMQSIDTLSNAIKEKTLNFPSNLQTLVENVISQTDAVTNLVPSSGSPEFLPKVSDLATALQTLVDTLTELRHQFFLYCFTVPDSDSTGGATI